jgi:hypothetical protein
MWQTLLIGLLLKLIEGAGPVIIELILKWLASLSGEQQKALALVISDTIKNAQTKKPA